jgi:hypothetical protein
MELIIDTTLYESHHGKKPTANKKGDWHFYVPAQYGKRAWLFVDVTFKAACQELTDRATAGGVFRLAP